MKNFIIIFLFTCSFFISSLPAKALHLLVMADNTNELKRSAIKNVQNIEDSFSYLCAVSKIPLHIKKLTKAKGNLTQKHILTWIRKESVAQDDVIILYYTGHGTRTHMSRTIWPLAYFPETPDKNIRFSDIIEKLFEKRAALYLVLLDCCNSLGEPKGLPRSDAPCSMVTFELNKSDNKQVVEGFQELFFKLHGLIIATGTSPLETGWNEDCAYHPLERGGVFTKIFLNYFFQDLRSNNPQWSHIFKKTKHGAFQETKSGAYRDIPCEPHTYQTPQYKIFLHKRRRSPRVYKEYFLKHSRFDPHSLSAYERNFFSRRGCGQATLNQKISLPIGVTELDSDIIEEGDLIVSHEEIIKE